MKLLKLGTVCLDGTKVHANASRHSALSYGHILKQEHHPHWKERFTEPNDELMLQATAMQRMTHRLKTKAGRAIYALRKQTVELVFGIIKSVMGFRQFSLRGLSKVTGEWALVCLAWNIKRMAVLRPKFG